MGGAVKDEPRGLEARRSWDRVPGYFLGDITFANNHLFKFQKGIWRI